MNTILRILVIFIFVCIKIQAMQPQQSQVLLGNIDNQTSRDVTLIKTFVVADGKGELGKKTPVLPAKIKSTLNLPIDLPAAKSTKGQIGAVPLGDYYHLNILTEPHRNLSPESFVVVIWQDGNILHVKTINDRTLWVEEYTHKLDATKKTSLNIIIAGEKFQDSEISITEIGSRVPVKLTPKVTPQAASPRPSVKLTPKVTPKPATPKKV